MGRGPGRTEGVELITGTDSDMSGPNNWKQSFMGTMSINGIVADKMYTLGDGGGNDYVRQANSFFASLGGALMTQSLKARLNAGASSSVQLGSNLAFAGGSEEYLNFTPTGTEQTFSGDFTVVTTGAYFLGLFGNALNGIAFEFDDILLRQVLTPSTNGLKIVEAPGSVTRNWATTGVGDLNDVGSVEFAVAAKAMFQKLHI